MTERRIDGRRDLEERPCIHDCTVRTGLAVTKLCAGATNGRRKFSDDAPLTDSEQDPLTSAERLMADFRGTGMTVGPHPMSYCRAAMMKLGVRTRV